MRGPALRSLQRLTSPPQRAASRSVSLSSHKLTHSAVVGPSTPPLSHETLYSYFNSQILAKHASRPALICRTERPGIHGGPPARIRNLTMDGGGERTYLAWDFEEFDRNIMALARGLVGLGVKKGDRIGVVMGNNSAYAMLQWACASIGAILVTLNPAYRLNEFISTLNLVGVSHLFVVPSVRTSHYVHMLASAFPSLSSAVPGEIQEERLPNLRHLVVFDDVTGSISSSHTRRSNFTGLKHWRETRAAVDFREVLMWNENTREALEVRKLADSLSKDEVVNLQFTSGTTGDPKAVSLTHSNLLNNGILIGNSMGISHEDVLCNVPPLFHCFDKSSSARSVPLSYLPLYPSPIYSPSDIVSTLVEEECTALHGVPTHFLGVLSEVEERRKNGENLDLSRLRTGIAAGSPVPIDLMKQLRAKMNLTDLTVAYGMTETSPVSFQTTPSDPVIKRVETVGKIHPHVTAKIVDDSGKVVPVGTPGEILVAGYLVQKGYWNDEERTAEVMKRDAEGTLWMHTGDEGVMDEEGYLKIVSRIKDIIIRGGENLFPIQIENVLTDHPAIREAAVVAVPDVKYGEVAGAWIVLEPNTQITREEVRNIVAEGMNPQNAPAWVWFLGEPGVAAELPKTASGKVMKHILRGWSKDLVQSGSGEVNGRNASR
ncbi:putative NRPS-like protein biosynthetic cluster [Steccherinum ochraceum]|uniref:Putative NRPS-like protein biosynthetic cluster n=1 Tax=Steccherinum ochraceum TaxID=92696 RepID=A0A4R0RJ93_9APHY|nr:putative NRPS-like protein biosynthetic cluster [Steccherinum ochraceum]